MLLSERKYTSRNGSQDAQASLLHKTYDGSIPRGAQRNPVIKSMSFNGVEALRIFEEVNNQQIIEDSEKLDLNRVDAAYLFNSIEGLQDEENSTDVNQRLCEDMNLSAEQN